MRAQLLNKVLRLHQPPNISVSLGILLEADVDGYPVTYSRGAALSRVPGWAGEKV